MIWDMLYFPGRVFLKKFLSIAKGPGPGPGPGPGLGPAHNGPEAHMGLPIWALPIWALPIWACPYGLAHMGLPKWALPIWV